MSVPWEDKTYKPCPSYPASMGRSITERSLRERQSRKRVLVEAKALKQ